MDRTWVGCDQAVLYKCMKLFRYKPEIFSKKGECGLCSQPHHSVQRKLSTKQWNIAGSSDCGCYVMSCSYLPTMVFCALNNRKRN